MTVETQTLVESGTEIFVALNKLKKSPRNARKTAHGEAAIEALAASIEAKGLLQNLVVEPERDANDAATGFYFVTIGEGRRLALLLRAKRKQIKKNEPIRCVLDTANDPHEISLDENVTRTAMHPADQFEAFQRLVSEQGRGVEEVAARFGVTALVVRQRLKIASVSPALIQIYRDGDMSLDQLMAFAVTSDQARQIEVWEGLSWNKEPAVIKRALNEDRVSGRDRRALFVGAEAYEAAGGVIERDLFANDYGGYLTDPSLLDRLALERLSHEAAPVEIEGWRWLLCAFDLPPAHGFRRIYPHTQPLTEDDAARLAELTASHDALLAAHEDADEIPELISIELDALTAEIDTITHRGSVYDPDEVARAGAFVVLGHNGEIQVHRGFVRPEDEVPGESLEDGAGLETVHGDSTDMDQGGEEEGDRPSPLSERLIADLTAHRTAALRDRIAERPDIALIALLHTLVLQTFYRGGDLISCLEFKATSTNLAVYAIGIDNSPAGQKIVERHTTWAVRMPGDACELWAFLLGMTDADRSALLAHCSSLSVNAVRAWGARLQALRHADQLAEATQLEMAPYWTATVERYFGRVTKAHILTAVREAVSDDAARRIDGLKKAAMAETAAELVSGTDWLPTLLRREARTMVADTLVDIAAE